MGCTTPPAPRLFKRSWYLARQSAAAARGGAAVAATVSKAKVTTSVTRDRSVMRAKLRNSSRVQETS
jgi:hypothetical protein